VWGATFSPAWGMPSPPRLALTFAPPLPPRHRPAPSPPRRLATPMRHHAHLDAQCSAGGSLGSLVAGLWRRPLPQSGCHQRSGSQVVKWSPPGGPHLSRSEARVGHFLEEWWAPTARRAEIRPQLQPRSPTREHTPLIMTAAVLLHCSPVKVKLTASQAG
jgi:hypothetical protein